MEDQNSDETAANISNKILEEEHNITINIASSYSNSYTRTQLQSNIFNYTWTIDGFDNIFRMGHQLISPPFPETAQYQIKIEFHKDTELELHFCIITKRSFRGSCCILIEDLSCRMLYNRDIKLFLNTQEEATYVNACSLDALDFPNDIPKQINIKCILEVFEQILSVSVHTPLFLTNPEVKNPICDDNYKDDIKLVKFIINGISYNVPTHILYATNSRYFKSFLENIQMKNEIKIENFQANYFKTILIYIQTGLLKFPEKHMTYQELLKNAYKYDVQDLKLICEQYLVREVTYQTAVEFMKLALLYDAKYLAEYTASIIKFNYEKIVWTKEFQLLQQEHSDKINELLKKSKIYKDFKDLSL